MSAAQKTAILAQVGHFYFGAVGQFYVGANRKSRRRCPLLIERMTALAADHLKNLAWKGKPLGSETRQVRLRLGF